MSSLCVECTEPAQCPICFENIIKTISVTECGHKFHTSCLLKNVAKNGFSCPCCRTLMVEKEEKEEKEESERESTETFGEGWIQNRLYWGANEWTEEERAEWIRRVVYGPN